MRLQHLAIAVRLISAMALLWATLTFLSHARTHPELLIGWAELVGCVILLLPRVWLAGAALLLVVFAGAFTHHAIEGQTPLWLAHPSL